MVIISGVPIFRIFTVQTYSRIGIINSKVLLLDLILSLLAYCIILILSHTFAVMLFNVFVQHSSM